jgi:hypothetical protein
MVRCPGDLFISSRIPHQYSAEICNISASQPSRLLVRVPKSKVYAVNVGSNMIKHAKRNLKDLENVELVHLIC